MMLAPHAAARVISALGKARCLNQRPGDRGRFGGTDAVDLAENVRIRAARGSSAAGCFDQSARQDRADVLRQSTT